LAQSPVLVGRDDFLALTGRRLTDATAGTGQLLFVAGEAGIGKTRLLGEVALRPTGLPSSGRWRSRAIYSRSPVCCWIWPAIWRPHMTRS
jgi:hypothetical protein